MSREHRIHDRSRRFRKHRKLIALAGTLALAATLAACGSSSSPSAASNTSSAKTLVPVKFTLLKGSPSNEMIYLAQKLGYFKANGIDATLVTALNGPASPAAVVGGSADVALCTVTICGALVEQGQPFEIIDGNQTNILTIVGAKSLHAPSTFPGNLQVLEGKTVVTPSLKGDNINVLEGAIQAAGVPNGSVTISAAGTPVATIAAMESGRAVATPGDQLVRAELLSTGNFDPLVDFELPIPSAKGTLIGAVAGIPQWGFWAEPSWVNSHKTAVQGIRTALSEAGCYYWNPANLHNLVSLFANQPDVTEPTGITSTSGLEAFFKSDSIAPFFSASAASTWIKFALQFKDFSQSLSVSSILAPGTPSSAAAAQALAQKAGAQCPVLPELAGLRGS